MDIFSLGCVIAELFMDGDPLFDQSSLHSYNKGTYTPITVLESKISDPHIRSMISKMISLNPEDRGNCFSYLNAYKISIFPISFYITLYPMISWFALPIMSSPDIKLTQIYKHLSYLWSMIYGTDFPIIFDYVNHEMFEKARFTSEVPFNNQSEPSLSEFNNDEVMREGLKDACNKEAIYILLKLILTQLAYCKFSSSKILGMRVVRIISQNVIF